MLILILKRLAVWFVETALGILLLGLALIALFGNNRNPFGLSLLDYSGAIFFVAVQTGLLFTTFIARAVWKGKALWSYSTVALALFLVHSEIFFVLTGGQTRLEQFSMQAAGACSVFASTFAGTLVLRRWTAASSKSVMSRS